MIKIIYFFVPIPICTVQNASIVNVSAINACFENVSITNFYADPAVIDNCSFVYNMCMNNCSIVNLDVSGNVSF